MSEFVAIIRDESGNGVRADQVAGWESGSGAYYQSTRVHLIGGGSVLVDIDSPDFLQRLDRALTAALDQGNQT